jgi:hypothetical protein
MRREVGRYSRSLTGRWADATWPLVCLTAAIMAGDAWTTRSGVSVGGRARGDRFEEVGSSRGRAQD